MLISTSDGAGKTCLVSNFFIVLRFLSKLMGQIFEKVI